MFNKNTNKKVSRNSEDFRIFPDIAISHFQYIYKPSIIFFKYLSASSFDKLPSIF